MANTRAVITNDRGHSTSRLGARYVVARADTWRTFATVTTWADGRVTVRVVRDGRTIHDAEIGAELDSATEERVQRAFRGEPVDKQAQIGPETAENGGAA